MASPRQAAAVEFGQEAGLADDLGAEVEGGLEAVERGMADRGSTDGVVPDAADRVVEQDAHEAMIEADGPAMGGGHGGQGLPGQDEPSADQVAPLILTLGLAAEGQARLDRLREAFFPPARNFLQAHVTLFHHLPGAAIGAIGEDLEHAVGIAPFQMRITRVFSLGRGVALGVEADALGTLRAGLARRWAGWLGAQDRQGFRPHVTIQNKVDPAVAKRTLAEVSAGFVPWEVEATGLCLWWYRGGPWEAAGRFPFAGRPAL